MGEDAGRTRGLTVAEAAEVLGISAEAVRKRIARGTLTTTKEGGSVFILLSDADQTREDTGRTADRTDQLIAQMQDRIEALEAANRENRRIIAALTQRIPEIEAPSEPAEPRSDRPGAPAEAQEGAERVSWWRRVFGG